MAAQGGAEGALKKLENTDKRDQLVAWEQQCQQSWQNAKIFDADAPSMSDIPESASLGELHEKAPKFFGTMAYPYTNGVAHLGHAFTISKVEFQSRASRHLGKRTLYPQGYHVTGMPIKAAADKIANEVNLFGPNFELPEEDASEDAVAAPTEDDSKADVKEKAEIAAGKFKAKKNKAALKGAGAKYQFQTMLSMGVPRDEIAAFQEPRKWVEYFPKLWERDLNALGCSIDWRRSFCTTDINPYYDSFVQWQMRKIKSMDRIKFGKRYTIFSPKDQQACLDHDRSSGEGVTAQEYTALKLKVTSWSDSAKAALGDRIPAHACVYLVAATLRPETMYGQTNLFVSPTITYEVIKVSESSYYMLTSRAARNCAFQEILPKWGEVEKVAEIAGSAVVGSKVDAPLSSLGEVYVVPMASIKPTKGTGVVTSVPSDSPDDFITSKDLAKKADYYGIKAEWVPQEYLELIDTPSYGKSTAKTIIEKMKISSPKDAVQLALAKEEAYKEGFYKGVMCYGDFSGKPVSEAKELVRQKLIKEGLAFAYSEPDGQVISRSGDECVAALLDQWFLTYGEADPAWRQEVLGHVNDEDGEGFNTYSPETLNAIQRTLSWLNQWAVTRQFGLGTKLPWQKTDLVESLSDSTIYMAYYTIAHLLHTDIYGSEKGPANIDASLLDDAFWEYIFCLSEKAPDAIPSNTLKTMRREFTYWYPLDVRISGKDLLNNHLIFFLYIHQAIWGSSGKPEFLPRGIRVNGHALLNGEKMSKSTGNFLTLYDAIKKYGSDPIRLALADAGDGIEDANVDENTANATILKLYELRKWCQEAVNEARVLKVGETFELVREQEKIRDDHVIQRPSGSPKTFWDQIFDNEMNILARESIDHFAKTNYKAALKAGYYDFTTARDAYRVSTTATGGMHADSVRQYVELQAILLAVITPHFSEYLWREILKKPESITHVRYPELPASDARLTAAMHYCRSVASNIGSTEGAMLKRAGKGKQVNYDPQKPKKLTIFFAKSYPAWQEDLIKIIQENLEGLSFDQKKIMPKIDKKNKKAMPFVMQIKKSLESGIDKDKIFQRTLPLNEEEVLIEMKPGLLTTIQRCKQIEIVQAEGNEDPAAQTAEPGSPGFGFVNVDA